MKPKIRQMKIGDLWPYVNWAPPFWICEGSGKCGVGRTPSDAFLDWSKRFISQMTTLPPKTASEQKWGLA